MGAYTNGFHLAKVMSAMTGRLGWKQPTQSPYAIVDTGNQASASGRYFNDGSFHPIVTIKNIKDTCEDPAISNSDFNALLTQMQKSAIMQCLSAVFDKAELIEQKTLFDRCLNYDLLIPNGSNFVGIRFRVPDPRFTVQINSLGLYFNEAATFTLYLYHDSKKDPIWQQSVTTVADDQTIITPTTELLLNTAINDYKTGSFYLGYYQDDLAGAQAIDEQVHEFADTKCFGFDYFQSVKTGTDFNRKQISITAYTYGINAEVSCFRDHTVAIIRNAPLFDEAVGLQMAYMVCKQVIYAASRSNLNERALKEQMDKFGLQYELDGSVPISDVPVSSGLQKRINNILARVRQSFFPRYKSQVVDLCS